MAEPFEGSDHLPHKRAGAPPADPRGLPRQRRGTSPQMHGRYPDFDVLTESSHWDPVTREVIRRRVEEVPTLRFFAAPEADCLRAFLDIVLAQDADPRVPVLEMVDAKLHEHRLDGYRFADMPEDPETWRVVARGLDGEARRRGARGFSSAPRRTRRDIVAAFAAGDLTAHEDWEGVNTSRAWSVVMRGALSEFYSHPWAWNEIGFGGPAYPRGYMRLQGGARGREPHEGREAFAVDPVADVPERGLH